MSIDRDDIKFAWSGKKSSKDSSFIQNEPLHSCSAAVRIVSCIRSGWMSKTLKNNFPTPHMRVMASINDAKWLFCCQDSQHSENNKKNYILRPWHSHVAFFHLVTMIVKKWLLNTYIFALCNQIAHFLPNVHTLVLGWTMCLNANISADSRLR